jgi:hypothetical protein
MAKVAHLVPATGPHAHKGSLIGAATTASEDEDLFATGQPGTFPEHRSARRPRFVRDRGVDDRLKTPFASAGTDRGNSTRVPLSGRL